MPARRCLCLLPALLLPLASLSCSRGNAARCAVELALLDASGHYFREPLSRVTQLLAPDLYEPREAVRYSGLEMRASKCTSCSGDFGLRDVTRVRDPFAAFLLDVGGERDAQAVAAVAVGGKLAV